MGKYLVSRPEEYVAIIERLTGKKAIQVTLQITENCCLACSYCYQHHKTLKAMDFETAKKIVDKILEYKVDEYATLILDFIGGEPLMEIDLIYDIMEYTINKMVRVDHPWLTYFRGSICSNGVLYFQPKVQEFFKRFHNYVSYTVSIDGNKELHDACRVDFSGEGSYDKAIAAVRHYRENYGSIDDTKMTISPDNVYYFYDAIVNLINENYTEIFVNCIFEEGWEYCHATELYNQLKKLADYMIENHLYDKIYIRMFDEDDYEPMSPEDNNNWCGGVLDENTSGISFDYKGDVFPCIRYMESSLNGRQKPLPLGNIDRAEQTDSEKENANLLKNITRRSQSTDECFNCPIAQGCSWCSGFNYEEFGTPNKRATYICCMQKAQSLANCYYLNKIYKLENAPIRKKINLPKEECLKIITEDEYNYLQHFLIEE